jgi:hypothetical protein
MIMKKIGMSARLASFLESRFWLFDIGSLLGKNRVSVYQWFATGNIKSVLGYTIVDFVIGPMIRDIHPAKRYAETFRPPLGFQQVENSTRFPYRVPRRRDDTGDDRSSLVSVSCAMEPLLLYRLDNFHPDTGSPSFFADETRGERDLVRLLSSGED